MDSICNLVCPICGGILHLGILDRKSYDIGVGFRCQRCCVGVSLIEGKDGTIAMLIAGAFDRSNPCYNDAKEVLDQCAQGIIPLSHT